MTYSTNGIIPPIPSWTVRMCRRTENLLVDDMPQTVQLQLDFKIIVLHCATLYKCYFIYLVYLIIFEETTNMNFYCDASLRPLNRENFHQWIHQLLHKLN